jgi:hypothetical protein
MIDSLKDKKFYILWLASILGSVSVLPYIAANSGIVVTANLVVSVLLQATFLYAFVVFFGMRISKKLAFKMIPSKKFIVPSIISGMGVGLAIKLLDKFIFATHANLLLQHVIDIEPWKGLLASFYGAVNEEILLRLFAVSLIAWLLKRFSKMSPSNCIVISIIFCALLFGLGHLPMLYKMVDTPNSWDVVRVMTLNGLAGVVFGILYWRYGLISSMLSHFTADLVTHVFWTL